MDLRTQTSLIAAVLSAALAATVLLRTTKRRVHWLFGLFGASVSSWYFTTFLVRVIESHGIYRFHLACALLVPLAGLQFFRAFLERETPNNRRMNRAALLTAALILILIASPVGGHQSVAAAIFCYVLVFLTASLTALHQHGRSTASGVERAKLRYLALVGGLAAFFTLVDYLPLVGLEIPPVGTILVLTFLYILSQSIVRYRLLDLYELVGRLSVLLALSFSLAAVLWLLSYFAGGHFFIHAVVAASVVLVLLEPLSEKVEKKIGQFFFRERYEFDKSIAELRKRLAHVLELRSLPQVLLAGLEESRRVTHAALYLLDEDRHGYDLMGHVGKIPTRRLELAPGRPLLDRLRKDGVMVRESMERELDERRAVSGDREAETLFEIVQMLEGLQAGVLLGLCSEEGDLYGLFCVHDDRVRDAFSLEEITLLAGLASQTAITLENSKLYKRMKERDRLAALGEMSAGLAHEIRNPLGAIKASAQYLTEPGAEVEREFLDIIVEEVDRLNRVVSSFLDYARPAKGDPSPTDVNAAVQRTMQLLHPECEDANIAVDLALSEPLPRVRIDVEQLRQVLINLTKNAVQAMETKGTLRIETLGTAAAKETGSSSTAHVEIRVSDTGPGIPQRVLPNLFIPFVTTKNRGTGLGLAISQRIIDGAGGKIDVRTHQGVGSTFIVRLPIADEPRAPGPLDTSPGIRSLELRAQRPVDGADAGSTF
ncbi:MAG: ATP-binding protein [Myxococcota bacterium]